MIYTDSPEYCRKILGTKDFDSALYAGEMLDSFFYSEKISFSSEKTDFLYLVREYSEESQFDILNELSRKGAELPPRMCCIAGHGLKFHGFHGRNWVALEGNLHVCYYLELNVEARKIGAGLSVLPAVSIIQALDEIPELQGKAGIKWVNDILIDGKKLCGFIASGQSKGEIFESAIIGIGLNIAQKPDLRSDGYVAGTCCTSDYCDAGEAGVLELINDKLKKNLSKLLESGNGALIEKYRERSVIRGKNVALYSDKQSGEAELIRRGKIASIGDNLELVFDDGDIHYSGRIREIT